MTNDQSGVDDPRFVAGDGFWGTPLATRGASDDEASSLAAGDARDNTKKTDAHVETFIEADAGLDADVDVNAELEKAPATSLGGEDGSFTMEGSQELEELAYDSGESWGGVSAEDFDADYASDADSTGKLQRVPDFFVGQDENAEPDATDDVEEGTDDAGSDGLDGEATDDLVSTGEGPELIDADYYTGASENVDATVSNNVYAGASEGLSERGKRIRLIAVAVAVAAALVAVYAMGVRRFEDRFLPNTSIQGHDVSGLTQEEATKSLEDETAGYELAVSVDDFATSVPGTDLGLERDEARIARDARAQQSAYAWPIRLLFHDDVSVAQDATFDEAVLDARMVEAVEDYNQQTLPASGASIRYDEEAGLYVLEGTVDGTALDIDVVREAARNDAKAFHTQSVPDAEKALRPATVQDLPAYAHSVEWANRSRTTDVPILINGEQVATAEAWQNAEWVVITDGPSVYVDTDSIHAWAEAYVANAAYHRDDWNDYYLDLDAFSSGLAERLATGVVDGYEAPCYDVLRREGESRALAYERGGWNSELGRYIDVDLEAQFARLFDDKGEVIWESAFVSGNMYEAHSTVTGTFNIYAMDRGVTLVGLDYNNDGKPDYESYVDYWMPFYGGYGLHDATWRYNFGGSLYYYDGSHGCINLPYKKAEELYGITFVGEIVNVHW